MNEPLPLVSVVVPCRDQAAFILEAIESVLGQNYSSVELVVVDCGSTDDSAKIIRETLERVKRRGARPRTRFEVRKDEGKEAAINSGIALTKGEFVAVLNPGEVHAPSRLERLVTEARRTGSELLFSLLELTDPSGREITANDKRAFWYHSCLSSRHHLPSLGSALLLNNFAVTSGNLFFTRRLFEKLGGFRRLRSVPDLDFLLRAIVETEPFLVPEGLMTLRLCDPRRSLWPCGPEAEDEQRQVIGEYLDRVIFGGPTPNPLAPGPANWPGSFHALVRTPRLFGQVPLLESANLLCPASARRALGPDAWAPTYSAKDLVRVADALKLEVCKVPQLFQEWRTLKEQWARSIARRNELHPRFEVLLERSEALRLDTSSGSLPVGRSVAFRVEFPEGRWPSEPPCFAVSYRGHVIATARRWDIKGKVARYLALLSREHQELDPCALEFFPVQRVSRVVFEIPCLESNPLEEAPVLDRGALELLGPYRIHWRGRTFWFRETDLAGYVDEVKEEADTWRIVGWAADRGRREGPETIHVFVNRRHVPTAVRLIERSDVSRPMVRPGIDPEPQVGFDVLLEKERLPGGGTSVSSKVDAYAVFPGGTALRLLGQHDLSMREAPVPLEVCREAEEALGAFRFTQKGWVFTAPDGKAKEWNLAQTGPIGGMIDSVSVYSGRVSIGGWISSCEGSELPDALLVCANSAPIAVGRATLAGEAPASFRMRFRLSALRPGQSVSIVALSPSGKAGALAPLDLSIQSKLAMLTQNSSPQCRESL